MRLYLVRHASAADAQRFQGPDEDRPLTTRGRDELREVLPRVAAAEAPPRVIWTSPLVRAVQTAEYVIHHWAPGAELRVTRALLSGADPSTVIEEISALSPESPLALVGHEPHLGLLLTMLVGAQGQLAMPKASVARIRYRPEDKPVGSFKMLDAPGLSKPVTDLKALG